jgi:hypothetical protein
MLYQSALGQVSMQACRARPYHPQVPGAKFGLGVRCRHALTLRGPRASPLAIHRSRARACRNAGEGV